MSHVIPRIARFRLCLFAGVCLLSAAIFNQEIQAQPSAKAELAPGKPPVVTNLLQLSRLLDSSSRMVAEVRLSVLVCSASRPEIGVVAVKDKTGSEILELGSRDISIVPGDVLHIESQRCFLRKREVGIEITQTPDLDNDGPHAVITVSNELYLTSGLHPFQLDYFNFLNAYDLQLTCRLPDGSEHPADEFLVRPGSHFGTRTNMVPGLDAAYYEGTWLNLPDFSLLEPIKTMATSNLNPKIGRLSEQFGIRFKGYFSAPTGGTYSFNLASDDGSLLYLNEAKIPLAISGHEVAPPPAASSIHTPMSGSEPPKWVVVEGRVAFVSPSGRGFRFELQSLPDSVWVTVADGGELGARYLLNSRISVRGIARVTIAPDGDGLFGELSVATSQDIKIIEDSTTGIPAAGTVPALLNVGKIQGLSKAEATRNLPVKIQGVVTSIAPPKYHYLSVQDETRGIFVRLTTNIKSSPMVGELCEVDGHTDAGDFAPIVVADHVDIIGKGRMPLPARPTWKELINGSMDVQWVELQGLVASVHSNSVALLFPEGELEVEVGGYTEPQLRNF